MPNPVDWDQPGLLSIVVQGSLTASNLVETARHCHHWRELFPHAELVLAISVTDVVVGRPTRGRPSDGRLVEPSLAGPYCHDGQLAAALDVLTTTCDVMALAEPALPLPPVKRDWRQPNNANLQLAAARRGLALATGRYVLRTRSDLIFLNRGFLAQHAKGDALPRGPAAMLAGRVLISWIYTLNPYTVERLPFHFSDWFHFGLTEDVRRLWAVPALTLRDALHYKSHPYAPGSNEPERQFLSRWATEQHFVYQALKGERTDILLDHHNDPRSAELSMDVLADNFVVCDLLAAGCVFDKYEAEFNDGLNELHCLTAADWRALALGPRGQSRAILAGKIATAEATLKAATRPAYRRLFEAAQLRTAASRFDGTHIVAEGTDGLVFYGPYVRLEPGHYRARVEAADVKGPGTVKLSVTAEAGTRVLARRRVRVGRDGTPPLVLSFSVPPPGAVKVEVVCRIEGLPSLVVTGVLIADAPAPRAWRRVLRSG